MNSHLTPKQTDAASPDRPELIGQLDQILAELKTALNKPSSCRVVTELFQIQELLIKMSNLLVASLNEISSDEVKSTIYSCLKKVALRPELSLQSIGYDKE